MSAKGPGAIQTAIGLPGLALGSDVRDRALDLVAPWILPQSRTAQSTPLPAPRRRGRQSCDGSPSPARNELRSRFSGSSGEKPRATQAPCRGSWDVRSTSSWELVVIMSASSSTFFGLRPFQRFELLAPRLQEVLSGESKLLQGLLPFLRRSPRGEDQGLLIASSPAARLLGESAGTGPTSRPIVLALVRERLRAREVRIVQGFLAKLVEFQPGQGHGLLLVQQSLPRLLGILHGHAVVIPLPIPRLLPPEAETDRQIAELGAAEQCGLHRIDLRAVRPKESANAPLTGRALNNG